MSLSELIYDKIILYDIPHTQIICERHAMATILLVASCGASIWPLDISAADLFDLESENRPELEDANFWDEHSLDSQRFYSTLCHVYDNNPAQFESLPEEPGFSEERAEMCIIEFAGLSKSWSKLLEPYRK